MGCTHAGGECKADSIRARASKLGIEHPPKSVLTKLNPKIEILKSIKMKQ